MKQTLFLVDGNSLLNRAYYALPPLTTKEGVPTNAVYGFTMMLFRIIDDYAPTHIYVAFDVAKPTFRHEAYQEYKANRAGMPDDLKPQVELMKRVLDTWGIARLEMAGYEADDIIGTASKQGEAAGFQVYILTGDRDALQLVSEHTSVLLTKKGIKEIEIVTPKVLKEQFGLEPHQVIDLKGLMGDSSDNIPGVPGVGEKTALKLVAKYGSIEALYANIDQEQGKLKEKLVANRDLAFLSKQLATIDRNIPLQLDFSQSLERNESQLIPLFTELEFRTLIERLHKDKEDVTVDIQSLPLQAAAQPVTYTLIASASELADLEQQLKANDLCAVYLDEGHLAVAVGEQVWYTDEMYVGAVARTLHQLSNDLSICCNDAKTLYKLIVMHGGDLADFSITDDVQIASYVLDPSSSHDLSSLSVRYAKLAPLAETGSPAHQAVARAKRILQLMPHLHQLLAAEGMLKLYQDVEMPLAKILTKMELRGIKCNPEKLQLLSTQMETALNRLTEEIYTLAGEKFNINSPKQLGYILFEKLGLPVIKKTKTGPSTDAEVLEQLSYHPLIAKLLEYRQLTKLKSTYADALANLINPMTGRIHTTFNQTVTATGRLSSTNPNLQNIPIRTAEGRKIRGAFESETGWYLLSADYSQIELRVLAHISGDQRMIAAFNSGVDVHRQTASEVFQVPLDAVTPEQRSAAKAINFGIVYGISSFGLAKGTNLSRAQAQQYIDQYFTRYPQVKAYLDNIVKSAKEQGYVTTLLNRRRYLPDIKSKNYQRRSFAERMAMNTPIQGSAADIIKMAMLKVDQSLRANNLRAQLLLQVHDELVLEVPEDEITLVAALIKQSMESVIELAVALEVEVKIGTDWENVKPMNEVK